MMGNPVDHSCGSWGYLETNLGQYPYWDKQTLHNAWNNAVNGVVPTEPSCWQILLGRLVYNSGTNILSQLTVKYNAFRWDEVQEALLREFPEWNLVYDTKTI